MLSLLMSIKVQMRSQILCMPIAASPLTIWTFTWKYTHTGEHEVTLLPSEDGALPQGAKRSDVPSSSTALPVPPQILPGLL